MTDVSGPNLAYDLIIEIKELILLMTESCENVIVSSDCPTMGQLDGHLKCWQLTFTGG